MGLLKMCKLDSFVKECHRLHPFSSRGSTSASFSVSDTVARSLTSILHLSAVSNDRMAMRDFVFSDGTFIPKGTIVHAPIKLVQTESKYYEDPLEFRPWRFVTTSPGEGAHSVTSSTTASPGYIAFGLGRHTWCVSLCRENYEWPGLI